MLRHLSLAVLPIYMVITLQNNNGHVCPNAGCPCQILVGYHSSIMGFRKYYHISVPHL